MKFKQGTAIIFEPTWWSEKYKGNHPLEFGEIVYFLCKIPNIPGHCIVVKHNGIVISMVHPQDFREATEDEL